MKIKITPKEKTLIQAYIEAVHFTENNHDDLCEVFKRESVIDCLSFYNRISCYISDDEIEQSGHDFWLTRNGYGAGSWDGDWKERGDMLTKKAESYGEAYPIFETAKSN